MGFVFTHDGVRYYHAGDTDAVPEMRDVRCHVALLPVSGTYVMTCEEACAACDLITAQVVVPMHYGDIVGTEADAERFRDNCSIPVSVSRSNAADHQRQDRGARAAALTTRV